jgi:colanic acid biosynthesis glycosyl transferase WcaI
VGSITAEEISAAGAGVRVDAGDPHALLRAALTLGRDIEGASALGGRGARFQKEVLSRDAAISHYAEIINGLAGKSGL